MSLRKSLGLFTGREFHENLFSSPSKQASSAASASEAISQQDITQAEDYANQSEGQERSAIASTGPNPYFGAAADQNPSNYTIDPTNVATFSTPAPMSGTPAPISGNSPQLAPQNTFSSPSSGTRQAQPVARNGNAQ